MNAEASPETQAGTDTPVAAAASAISPGEMLRRAREALNLTISDLAGQTRLSRAVLEALENNDFANLAMPVYVRGYFRKCAHVLNVPEAYLGLFDTVIVFDHLYRRIHFISHREPHAAHALGERFKTLLEDNALSVKPMRPLFYQDLSDDELFSGISHSVSKATYCAAVEQAKQYITEGQIFQIVLAQRFSLPVNCNDSVIEATRTG